MKFYIKIFLKWLLKCIRLICIIKGFVLITFFNFIIIMSEYWFLKIVIVVIIIVIVIIFIFVGVCISINGVRVVIKNC